MPDRKILTLPKPMTQSVLPTIETPTYLERAHLPAFTLASACATLRDRAQISAMPCSAAATVLAVGAFTTKQPCCAAHNTRASGAARSLFLASLRIWVNIRRMGKLCN